jgi:hypothetical protein
MERKKLEQDPARTNAAEDHSANANCQSPRPRQNGKSAEDESNKAEK